MRTRLLLTALLLPFLLEAAPRDPRKRVQARHYDFKEAKKRMAYTLFVPSRYKKETKTPLLVVLHGLFGNPRQMINTDGLVAQAEKHGFIVACPMGYDSGSWYGSRGPGSMGIGGPENQGALSEQDVMNVLGIVRKEFNVDPKRIYLGGHSMGGTGTLYLASKYPDTWAGLAPIAPWLATGKRDLQKIRHLPVVFVQGDADKICWPFFARGCVGRMNQLKVDLKYIEEKGGEHIEVAAHHWPEIFKFLKTRRRK